MTVPNSRDPLAQVAAELDSTSATHPETRTDHATPQPTAAQATATATASAARGMETRRITDARGRRVHAAGWSGVPQIYACIIAGVLLLFHNGSDGSNTATTTTPPTTPPAVTSPTQRPCVLEPTWVRGSDGLCRPPGEPEPAPLWGDLPTAVPTAQPDPR